MYLSGFYTWILAEHSYEGYEVYGVPCYKRQGLSLGLGLVIGLGKSY